MKQMAKRRSIVGLGLALVLAWTLAVTALAQMGPPGGPGPMAGLGAQLGPMMGCQALWNLGFPRTPNPLTIDQVIEAVQKYLILLRNPDLVLSEVIDFTNHFQARVKEKSTGANAFNLLVDKLSTGAVCWEPGPNMMWNTKYRFMGWGHMHGPPWWLGTPTTQMPITPERAKQLAQSFLNLSMPGTTVGEEVEIFYGFYDLYVAKDGKILGELSVNGYTGLVWYQTWHGPFVAVKRL